MIKITDLVNSLSGYLEAQRQLEQCRRTATGDVDYYCHSYAQDLKRAEESLKQSFDAYIDQRIAEKTMPREIRRSAVAAADMAAVA